MQYAAPTDPNNRYDPDVWVSPSGECQVPDANVQRVATEDTFGKICFKDTLDLAADLMFEEAISSDDEDDLNADTVQGCILTIKKVLQIRVFP